GGTELPLRDVLVEPMGPANVGLYIRSLQSFHPCHSRVDDRHDLVQCRCGSRALIIARSAVKVLDPLHGRIQLSVESWNVKSVSLEDVCISLDRRLILSV